MGCSDENGNCCVRPTLSEKLLEVRFRIMWTSLYCPIYFIEPLPVTLCMTLKAVDEVSVLAAPLGKVRLVANQ